MPKIKQKPIKTDIALTFHKLFSKPTYKFLKTTFRWGIDCKRICKLRAPEFVEDKRRELQFLLPETTARIAYDIKKRNSTFSLYNCDDTFLDNFPFKDLQTRKGVNFLLKRQIKMIFVFNFTLFNLIIQCK